MRTTTKIISFLSLLSVACSGSPGITTDGGGGTDSGHPNIDGGGGGTDSGTTPHDGGGGSDTGMAMTDSGGGDNCGGATDCATCTGMNSCGWCSATNSCATATSCGPVTGACASGFVWIDVDCSAPPSCASATNCGACTMLTGCDWCTGSNTCVKIDTDTGDVCTGSTCATLAGGSCP